MPARSLSAASAKTAADLNAIAEVNRRSVMAMTEMNRRMFRAMVSVQSELLDFSQRRFAEDMSTACKLAGCRRPEAAMEVVRDFQSKALHDFSREANELMRVGAAAARAKPGEDDPVEPLKDAG